MIFIPLTDSPSHPHMPRDSLALALALHPLTHQATRPPMPVSPS